jgi:hypothetical protein
LTRLESINGSIEASSRTKVVRGVRDGVAGVIPEVLTSDALFEEEMGWPAGVQPMLRQRVGGEPPLRKMGQRCTERCLKLPTGEHGTDAEVKSGAEGKMLSGWGKGASYRVFLPGQDELVRIWEEGGIAVSSTD